MDKKESIKVETQKILEIIDQIGDRALRRAIDIHTVNINRILNDTPTYNTEEYDRKVLDWN